jgi:hypothetical protein
VANQVCCVRKVEVIFLSDLGNQFLHSRSYGKIYGRQAGRKEQDLVVLKHA